MFLRGRCSTDGYLGGAQEGSSWAGGKCKCKTWRENQSFCPFFARFSANCHSALDLHLHRLTFTRRHARQSVALCVCACHLFCNVTCLVLRTLCLSSSSPSVQVKQRNRKLVKEREGTGLDCWVTCCSVTFLENSRQALTCPGKTAPTVTLGASRWWALI